MWYAECTYEVRFKFSDLKTVSLISLIRDWWWKEICSLLFQNLFPALYVVQRPSSQQGAQQVS